MSPGICTVKTCFKPATQKSKAGKHDISYLSGKNNPGSKNQHCSLKNPGGKNQPSGMKCPGGKNQPSGTMVGATQSGHPEKSDVEIKSDASLSMTTGDSREHQISGEISSSLSGEMSGSARRIVGV